MIQSCHRLRITDYNDKTIYLYNGRILTIRSAITITAIGIYIITKMLQ